MTALTTQRYAYPKPKTTEYGTSSKGSRAQGANAVRTGSNVANPTRLIHYECPGRPRESLCGAPVQGVYTEDAVECAVCVAVWRELLP